MALDPNLLEDYVRACTTRWNRRRSNPTITSQFVRAVNALHDYVTAKDELAQRAAYANAGLPAPMGAHEPSPIPGHSSQDNVPPPGGYRTDEGAPALEPVRMPRAPMAPAEDSPHASARREPNLDPKGREIASGGTVQQIAANELEAQMAAKMARKVAQSQRE